MMGDTKDEIISDKRNMKFDELKAHVEYCLADNKTYRTAKLTTKAPLPTKIWHIAFCPTHKLTLRKRQRAKFIPAPSSLTY